MGHRILFTHYTCEAHVNDLHNRFIAYWATENKSEGNVTVSDIQASPSLFRVTYSFYENAFNHFGLHIVFYNDKIELSEKESAEYDVYDTTRGFSLRITYNYIVGTQSANPLEKRDRLREFTNQLFTKRLRHHKILPLIDPDT